ncbi:MAG TPA: nucleoside transporter [Kiritimatiellae bacterium]|nr:nucleoside transporter [Kiritimatiellia bacterium]
MALNLVSLGGLAVLLGFAALLSTDRRRINPRVILWGLAIQFAFAAFIFGVPLGSELFLRVSRAVERVLRAARAGTRFCFGILAAAPGEEGSLGFILLFQGLATIVFFAALMEVLYYFGIVPWILKQFSRVFTRLMRVSGAESLCTASNIVVGIESATTIRPFLERMTSSELCTILTAGLATIASSVLGLYVLMLKDTFPNIAGHLVSASFLSAPAALVMSKMLLPESEVPETLGTAVKPHYERPANLMAAVMRGADAGGRLVLGILVLLLAVLGLVELVNMGLEWLSAKLAALAGGPVDLSLPALLGWMFYPFAVVIGAPLTDAAAIARLLGERAVLTEVPAYQHLAQMLQAGNLTERGAVLASYALCGFTHVAAVGIFTGGIAALAPRTSGKLAAVAARAFLAATLACLMTAAVAGVFYHGGSLLYAGR